MLCSPKPPEVGSSSVGATELHAEDLDGRSALALLACLASGARVLFLTSAGEAIVHTSCIDQGRFTRVPVRGLASLPFGSGVFGGVVVDGDLAEWSGSLGSEVIDEIDRVTAAACSWVVLTRHRRRPRNPLAVREYRLRLNGDMWAQELATISLQAAERGYLRFDNRRLTDILLPSRNGVSDVNPEVNPVSADAQCVVFRRKPADDFPILRRVLDDVGAYVGGGPARADRLLVRKIGKTAILATSRATRVIVRIPRSSVAASRAVRNFDALTSLHQPGALPANSHVVIPRALFQGRCGDFEYFVEEALDGRPPPDTTSSASWDEEALRFITDLHLNTRQPRVVDDACFETRFAAPLRRIRRITGDGAAPVFERLISVMGAVVGECLPFVRSHGDYALGNCLYRPSGVLAAVVDWELSSAEGLPLLDLLQCMPVPHESNSRPRWQRFDAVMTLVSADPTLRHVPELRAYIECLQIPDRAVPVLLMMYWVDHVANRIEARASDDQWMKKRVDQPLASLQSIFAERQAARAHG